MRSYRRDGLTFDVDDSDDLPDAALGSGPPDPGGGDGQAVVLLHGFPQDRTAWAAVAPELRAAGLRTLAPDQRGYSPGARPRGRRAYRVAECAADVVALLDAAGVGRAHVVGHDWGGMVAWALGAGHADRVASLTVLSTPHPAAFTHALTHSTQGLKSWYMAFFQLPVVPEVFARRTLARTLRDSGLPRDLAERYDRRMAEPGALSAALAWYRAMPFSVREPVGRVRVPTTYVWGRRDFALGRSPAEATAGYVRGPYRFVELDAGHWLPETRAGEVAAIVLEQVRSAMEEPVEEPGVA